LVRVLLLTLIPLVSSRMKSGDRRSVALRSAAT
jgi:hypothetical protein